MPRTGTSIFLKNFCKTCSVSVYKGDILKNKHIALKTSLKLAVLLCHSLIQISFIFQTIKLYITNILDVFDEHGNVHLYLNEGLIMIVHHY